MDGKALFREVIEQVWHRGNLGFVDEAYHPEYVANVPRGELQHLADYRRYVTETRAAFPDIRIYVQQQVAEGDFVVSRHRIVGTHTGDFMGLAPTGRPIDVAAMTMERLSGGRFAESWSCWDVIGLLHEIGLVPDLAELARSGERG